MEYSFVSVYHACFKFVSIVPCTTPKCCNMNLFTSKEQSKCRVFFLKKVSVFKLYLWQKGCEFMFKLTMLHFILHSVNSIKM